MDGSAFSKMGWLIYWSIGPILDGTDLAPSHCLQYKEARFCYSKIGLHGYATGIWHFRQIWKKRSVCRTQNIAVPVGSGGRITNLMRLFFFNENCTRRSKPMSDPPAFHTIVLVTWGWWERRLWQWFTKFHWPKAIGFYRYAPFFSTLFYM